ncbi:MAG: hypothetical protein U0791_16045 [Gemmataceae bacterium]
MDVVTNRGRTTRWLRGTLGGALLASGMTALAAPPQQRAAILLPPVKMEPGELPTLARGAIDDVPVGSTPVARKAASAGGPAWVSGVDPNVIPAAGFTPFRDKTETKTPILSNAKDLPPLTPSKLNASVPPPQPRPLDKPKSATPTERLIPPLLSTPEQPGDPNMPLRGTASNGAPVLAGPPAYRWYGYGTATPGANQYAPNGQYPKASANWYGVTGATPGAFPVPVVNPYRGVPGNEPPSYVANPPVRTIDSSKSTPIAVPPSPSVRPNPVSRSAPAPQTGVPAMPAIGSIGTSPSTPLPPLPTPVGVPAMPPVSPVKMTKPASPEPLPPTLRNDASMPVPVLPPPNLFSEPGANLIRNEIAARAQMPDGKQPDATASLIQGLCKGRADGVDVRWNSSRKLTVCFEVRTAPDATKLVKDISARPELAPFAIDFCVVVK